MMILAAIFLVAGCNNESIGYSQPDSTAPLGSGSGIESEDPGDLETGIWQVYTSEGTKLSNHEPFKIKFMNGDNLVARGNVKDGILTLSNNGKKPTQFDDTITWLGTNADEFWFQINDGEETNDVPIVQSVAYGSWSNIAPNNGFNALYTYVKEDIKLTGYAEIPNKEGEIIYSFYNYDLKKGWNLIYSFTSEDGKTVTNSTTQPEGFKWTAVQY